MCQDLDWIQLAQGCDELWASVNDETNLWSSGVVVGFSRTVFYGIS
jgi:hypothetical protein